jgi:hypothetical protein
MPIIETLIPALKSLKDRKVIYTTKDEIEITATHTAKFSIYDYAVGLKIPGREEFYPTHVRLLIDLHLKRISNFDSSKILFSAFEDIFEGNEPEKYKDELEKITFPMQLDNSFVNLTYCQLLMIEQDFNYGPEGNKKSKHDPPREFLMCFIRWVASQESEIDKVITAAVRNYPAPPKFIKIRFI